MTHRPIRATSPIHAIALILPMLPALALAQHRGEGEGGGDDETEARLDSWAVPEVVVAGQPFGAHFEYENRSPDVEWSDEAGWALVPVGPDADRWDLASVDLRPGEVVEPGDTRFFAFTARAPDEPGTYTWAWQLQNEGVQVGQAADPVDIVVEEADADDDPDPRFFREHRGALELHEQRPLAMRTDDGQPLFLMGKSAFGLLARRGSGPFMEEAAAQGFNLVRVRLLAPDLVKDPALAGEFERDESGGPWEFRRDEVAGVDVFDHTRERNRYWSRLDTLLDKAAEKGMVVQLVLFSAGALTYFESPAVFDDRKKAFVTQVVERLGDRLNEQGALIRSRQGHAWIEVIDEHPRGATGPGPFAHEGVSAEFVDEVARFVLSEEARVSGVNVEDVRRLVTASALPGDAPAFADAPWNVVNNLHLPKVDGWETRIRDLMMALRATGRPTIDFRSVGSGAGLPEAERDDDPVRHRTRLWAAASAGGYTVFHSGLGIPAATGTTPGMEAVAGIRRFFERLDHWQLEPGAEWIAAHDANDVWAWTSRGQFAAYFRTSGAGEGTVTIELPQRGARPLRYEVRWFDPATGAYLSREWLEAGRHTLDLPGLTPDAALMAATLDSLKTPALSKIEPDCLDTEFGDVLRIEGAELQPGVHFVVDGIGPVPVGFIDDRNAVFSAHRWLGEEFERDVYELVEGRWTVRLRNYTGRMSAPIDIRIVADSVECERPAGEGEGEGEPGGPPGGEGEGEGGGGEGEGEPDGPDGTDCAGTERADCCSAEGGCEGEGEAPAAGKGGDDGCGCRLAPARPTAVDLPGAALLIGLAVVLRRGGRGGVGSREAGAGRSPGRLLYIPSPPGPTP